MGRRREKRHGAKFFLSLFALQGAGHYLLFYTERVRRGCLSGLLYYGFLQNAYLLTTSAFSLDSVLSRTRHNGGIMLILSVEVWHGSKHTVKAPEYNVL